MATLNPFVFMKSLPSLLLYGALAAIISGLTTPAGATGQYFEDVFESTMYKDAIHRLAEQGILTGNPNGYFYPAKEVNRAELLKMLYEAADVPTKAETQSCFTDVPGAAWFAPYVCDAMRKGWVQGYSDGTFKPGQSVNTVETLKMITTVFGLTLEPNVYIPVPEYTDVDDTAWYYPYLQIVFSRKVAPIEGQNATLFTPAVNVLRGEAAAYIVNALEFTPPENPGKPIIDTETDEAPSRPQTNVDTKETPQPVITNFPWQNSGKFNENKTLSYEFTVRSKQTITVAIEQFSIQELPPRCALYKLEEDGLVFEYYIGVASNNSCTLLATISPGEYQVQFFPTVQNAQFTATISPSVGDKNDGYSEAKALTATAQTHTLEAYNTHNWYTFSLHNETDQTIIVSNSDEVTCSVYPMKNVDLFGFSGPKCNELYKYPAGDYYVSVKRKIVDLNKRTDYSVYRR